jgi:hypothetical protein
MFFFYKRDLDRGWDLLQLCAKVFRTWEEISLNLEVLTLELSQLICRYSE